MQKYIYQSLVTYKSSLLFQTKSIIPCLDLSPCDPTNVERTLYRDVQSLQSSLLPSFKFAFQKVQQRPTIFLSLFPRPRDIVLWTKYGILGIQQTNFTTS